MKIKIITAVLFTIIVSIGIFVYLNSKKINNVDIQEHNFLEVKFLGSKYPFPIIVNKDSKLEDVLIKLYQIDNHHYTNIKLDKINVDPETFIINRNLIFKVS